MPIVFGLGLVILITVLTFFVVVLRNEQREIQTRTEELGEDSNTIKSDQDLEVDEFRPSSLGQFISSPKQYQVVKEHEIIELCNFLKYNINYEENYQRLLEAIPGYLQNTLFPIDVINHTKVSFVSAPLNETLLITFLTVQNPLESRVYITQKTGDCIDIYTLSAMPDLAYVTFDILESGEIVVHFITENNLQNVIALVGDKARSPSILSYINTTEFVSFHGNGKVSIGGYLFSLEVEEGRILAVGEKGTVKEGLLCE